MGGGVHFKTKRNQIRGVGQNGPQDLGTKRTSACALHMSAIGGKADMPSCTADVRFWGVKRTLGVSLCISALRAAGFKLHCSGSQSRSSQARTLASLLIRSSASSCPYHSQKLARPARLRCLRRRMRTATLVVCISMPMGLPEKCI